MIIHPKVLAATSSMYLIGFHERQLVKHVFFLKIPFKTNKDSQIHLLEHLDGSELTSYTGHSNKRVKVQSALDPTDSFIVSGSEDRVRN